MEAFSKFRKIIPSGFRYLSISSRYTNNNKDASLDDDTQNLSLPFSRNGDSGHSVVDDIPLHKSDRIFDAIGNTDELLSHLGVARENAITNKHPYTDKLTRIQTMLVDIILAISKQNSKVTFAPQNTKELEEWIVKYTKELTPAENYLLPGGGRVSTSLHVARSVCRRAERSVIPLVKDGQLDQEVQVYFNRLADLLFTWARYAAKRDERSESVYTPKTDAKKKPAETKKEPKD